MTLRQRWHLWIAFTLLWTVALVVPIQAPVFSEDPDTQSWIRFVIAKTLHASAYAAWTILAGSLHTSFAGRISLLFFLMAHAVGTEIVQNLPWVNRGGCLRDSAIDQTGILLGLILSWSWWTRSDPSSGET